MQNRRSWESGSQSELEDFSTQSGRRILLLTLVCAFTPESTRLVRESSHTPMFEEAEIVAV
jgi:hypothetical protein